MKRSKVEDHSNLERDLYTQAIVNTDLVAYEKYINEKTTRLRYESELKELRSEIEVLKALLLNK
jgi:predicted GIY-YIG superfamily endonuclease